MMRTTNMWFRVEIGICLRICFESNSENEHTSFTILANLLFRYGNCADLLSSNSRSRRLEVRLSLANAQWLPDQTTSTIADWQPNLRRILTSSSPSNKIAIVGVGHPLRGDDHVGSSVAKSLLEQTNGTLRKGTYFFDAEDGVEALITRLADLGPKHVVFIDACEMGAKPGEARLLTVAQTSYSFFTTHGIPLRVLSERLLPESEVWVLAIQPKQTEFGYDLSPEVRDAAVSIAKFIMKVHEEGDRPIAD
jgi:hydrogenase 3 maturation protease